MHIQKEWLCVPQATARMFQSKTLNLPQSFVFQMNAKIYGVSHSGGSNGYLYNY